MKQNHYKEASVGTSQGGLKSPVLANVYLHYVLDLWFERKIKRYIKGEAYIVRCSDDFVIMFQYLEEAEKVYEVSKERLAKLGLGLVGDKTRILSFGRNSKTSDSFDFLEFTHLNGKSRHGKNTVKHKIS